MNLRKRNPVLIHCWKSVARHVDETQNETDLLAACLPNAGLVLMEVALEGKGYEIPGAAKLLKIVDLCEKVVMGDAFHTQRALSPNRRGGWELSLICQGRLPKVFEIVKETIKGQGRLEERMLIVSN